MFKENYINNLENRIVTICTVLIVLIPLGLVSGPFLPDLFLSLTCILFLFICLYKKDFSYFKNFFFIFFIFFWLYLIAISLASENFASSFKTSFFYIRFGIFSIAVSYLINKKKNFIKIFSFILLITVIFVCSDAYFQYFYGSNFIGLKPLDYPRISGFFGNELILGSYLSRIFPLLLSFYFLNQHNKKNLFFIFLITVFVEVLIILTGERTAIVYASIFAIFIILFIKEVKLLRVFTLFMVAALSIIIMFFNTETKKRIIDKSLMELGLSENKQVQINFEGVKPIYKNYYIFSPKHQSMILTSYNMFLDKKWTGHGPKSFREECDNEKYNVNQWGCSTHPHNIFFQLLSETGIIGLLFFLVAVLYLLKNLCMDLIYQFKNRQFYSNYQICLVGCFLITLWPFTPTGNFFNNWLSIIYYLPVGFYLNSLKT